MGKGAFPINLFPHGAWWGFAGQLGVRGWERLGLTQSLTLLGNCSSICKISVWDLRGFCAQGWDQGQEPPTLP